MQSIQVLRLLVRVVDPGSFSKAALEIGIGRPAATEVRQLYHVKCRLILHHVEEAEPVAWMQGQFEGDWWSRAHGAPDLP